MLILMVELKVCRWRASARVSGERSEPAAGRPRKEQAPKAPSRIASIEEYYLGLILILNKYDFDVDLNDKKVLWVKIKSVASVIPHLTMLSMLNSRS